MAVSPVPESARVLRFGVYQVNLTTGELFKSGVKIRLQEHSFRVLAMLLERPGELVTNEEIVKQLWPADTFVDFDHGLKTAVYKLREALRDTAANPRFIENLPRRGYRFIGDVQVSGIEPQDPELPRAPRDLLRGLFALIQIMYLAFYLVVLGRFEAVHTQAARVSGPYLEALLDLVVVTALLGVATRLFMLAAVLFDYQGMGQNFLHIFPLVVFLDELWAFAPLLLAEKVGLLALAAIAALLFLPFAQRTLIRMAYRKTLVPARTP